MKNTINKIMIGIILISITTGTSITALANSKTNYSLNQDTTKTINENNFLTNNVDKNHEYQGIPAGTHGVLLMSKSDFNINNYSQIEMTSFKGVSNGNDVNVTDPNMLIPKSNIMQSFKSGSSSINGNARVFPSYKYKSSFFRYKTVPGFSLKIVNGVLNFWLTPIFTKINDFSIVFTPISQIPLTPSFRKQTPLSPSFHKQSSLTPSFRQQSPLTPSSPSQRPLTPSMKPAWSKAGNNEFNISAGQINCSYQTTDGTMWVGGTGILKDFNGGSSIVKSTDGGKTWKGLGDLSSNKKVTGNIGRWMGNVRSIFQTKDGTIWVGGEMFNFRDLSGKFLPNQNGCSLVKSTDNGNSWTMAGPTFFEDNGNFPWITQIYQTLDGNMWIRGQHINVLDSSTSKKTCSLVRSTDGGKTWNNYNDNDLINKRLLSNFYQTKDGVIWLSCYGSILKSINQGKTWSLVDLEAFNNKITCGSRREVVYQTKDNSIWMSGQFDGTDNKGNKYKCNLIKSMDNGKTWNTVSRFNTSNFSSIYASINTIYQSNDGVIWIGTGGDSGSIQDLNWKGDSHFKYCSLLKSTDNGKTWFNPDHKIFYNNGYLENTYPGSSGPGEVDFIREMNNGMILVGGGGLDVPYNSYIPIKEMSRDYSTYNLWEYGI